MAALPHIVFPAQQLLRLCLDHPRPETPQLCWVAAEGDQIVGILDIEVAGSLATIDTLATHPDYFGRGIATELLARVSAVLPSEVTTLDAWTRDDEPALAWYRSRGFVESDHYLHVHKEWDDSDEGFSVPEGVWGLVNAHFHAPLKLEEEMRAKYQRVYVARRFVKEL